MFPTNIKRIEIDKLLPHEQFREEHVIEIMEWFERDGFQLRPIAVHELDGDDGRFLILDGHHRTECSKRLKLRYIMANVIDYFDPRIKVESWNNGPKLSKEEILQMALEGKTVAPKSTKHVIEMGEKMSFQDNDMIEPKIYASLETLK